MASSPDCVPVVTSTKPSPSTLETIQVEDIFKHKR